ncbi:MAG: hypothetical protein JWM33_3227 [Caulobacteraceae bacterium]|nr:hypothetical protein [Caulobacteraceae bacterium]
MNRSAPREDIEDYHALLRHSFSGFAEAMLQYTAPAAFETFQHNWHIEAIGHALTRVANGELRRLIILAPPRSLKSHMASVAFPAWLLGRDPSKRILCASHSLDLATKLSRDFRQVVQSPLYRQLYPGFRIGADRDAVNEIVTTRRGARYSTSIGGPAVGRGGDIWILDDLHKPDEVYSEELREKPYRWFRDTALTRLDDKATGAIVLVMQRLHPEDIAARLIAAGSWEVLCLPAIASQDIEVQVSARRRHTFRAGDYLQPLREGAQVLDEQRRAQGTLLFNAQYQQAPEDMSGGVVRPHWIQRYEAPLTPRRGDYVLQSWDVAVSEEQTADYSVCTTWVRRGQHSYLVDVWRHRRDLPDLARTAIANAETWSANEVVVEADGVGLPFYQLLSESVRRARGGATHRRSLRPLSQRPVRDEPWSLAELEVLRRSHRTDKVERLVACTPQIETGEVRFPTSAPWLEVYMRELLTFNGKSGHDDQVDSTSQALERLKTLTHGRTIRVAVTAH